jgi:hypothetical protein
MCPKMGREMGDISLVVLPASTETHLTIQAKYYGFNVLPYTKTKANNRKQK